MRISGYLYREILTLTGLLLAAVLGLGWWGVVRALDAQAWARAADASERAAQALDGELASASRVGTTLAGWWLDGTLRLDDPERVDALSLPLLEAQTFVSSVNLCSADGTSVLELRQPGGWHSRALRRRGAGEAELRWTRRHAGVTRIEPWDATGYDPRQRDWYTRVGDADAPRWSPEAYQFMTTQDPGITLSFPIRRAGALEGVIALDVMLDDLTGRLWAIAPTPGTEIVLADPQGRSLVLPHRAAFESREARLAQFLGPVARLGPELAPLADGLLALPPEGRQLVTRDAEGVAHYGLVRPYRGPAGLTWYVVVAIPEPEIMGVSRRRALGVLALAILGFVVLMLRARSIARRFGRPLDELAEAPGRPAAPAGQPTPAPPTVALAEALQRAGRAAHEHSTLREQLHHSQRRETVATLASGLAHDVNNQLTIVLGQLDPTLEALGPEHPFTPDLRVARHAARRCAEMMRALLTYSRGAPRQASQQLEVDRLVREVAALVGRVMGPQVTLTVEVEPGLPPLDGREVQLEQALVNLLINARDAMPEGGAVALRARRDGDGVRIEVSDSGPGMPPEVLARIFEPFFSTKAPGRGTGLGLPMVQHIAEDHGGRVEVESRPGAGTTFTLHLPAARA
ncbi:MAG: ATP-binding protein [Anaeromyxobacter sp.]